MLGIKEGGVGKIGLKLLFLTLAAPVTATAAEIPPAMLDFDRPVGFTKPLVATVFKAYGDEHLFYLVPNRLEVGDVGPGTPSTAVLYEKARSGRHAILSLAGTIGFGGDYDAAIDEIRNSDPSAKFAVAEPYSFAFNLLLPGSNSGGATIDTAKMTSAQHYEIYARIPDVTARILLVPDSYRRPAIAVIYAPTYHGIVRSDDGTPKISERRYEIGSVANGSCALAPERYLSWSAGVVGCVFPSYPYRFVFPIQKDLKRLGFYEGKLSGNYDNTTSRAIRKYQTARSLVADGIPSLDLAEALKKDKIQHSASQD